MNAIPLVLLLNALLALPAGPTPRARRVRQVCLANGLNVILRRIEGAPLVSVWSGIHAGSANERPGITGAAHWCEHMTFKGTQRYSRDGMKDLIERAGGDWNGYTWLDQTCYFETLPGGALELALDIEAQRMAASRFLPEAVEAERGVVISELQMGQNDPENLLDIETTAAAFTAHPYRWPTIGWQSDLEKMTREDLHRFYRRAYCPANATLVVAGDLDEERTLRMIRARFGALPPGEPLERLRTEEPEQRGERRVRVERAGAAAYLQLLYRTPVVGDPDSMPLLVLNAALGGADGVTPHAADWRGRAARSSILQRGLVETGLAAKAGSLFIPTKYPYVLCVYATAGEGIDPARLEAETIRVVEGIGSRGLGEAEFRKAVNGSWARFVYDCDGAGNQAQLLGFFDTIGEASFPWAFQGELSRVTAEEVRTAAARYLTERGRTVGWYLPAGRAGDAARPDRPRAEGAGRGPAGYRDAAAAPTPAHSPRRLPLIHLWPWKRAEAGAARVDVPATPSVTGGALRAVRTVLPNGLVLIVRQNRSSPSIVARAEVAAGSSFDPAGKAGLAHFTARMLERGTRGMSAALVAEVLDSSGTELEISCERDRASLSARMLRRKLSLVMETLAQMLREPVFPAAEIERLRGIVLTEIAEDGQDTAEVAADRAYELLYPHGHPYRHRVKGDAKSVRALAREDLAGFFRARYTPRATTIVLSGDVSAAEAAREVEKHFGSWDARGSGGGATLLTPPLPIETRWERVPIADKSQVEIVVGSRGVARDNPDYYALQLMNAVLGRFGMGGRLGRLLREEEGLAYHVESALVPYRGAGTFLVRAGVNPKNVDEALRGIRNELLRMRREGVTDEEVARGRECLVNSIPRMLETNAKAAEALAEIEFHGLGLDYFDRYPALIGRLTAQDIRRVANEYLYPDNLVIVLAGPVANGAPHVQVRTSEEPRGAPAPPPISTRTGATRRTPPRQR